MKTNKKMSSHCATLGLLFSAACILSEQSVLSQAVPQNSVPGSRRIQITLEDQAIFRQSYILSRTAADSLHAGQAAQAEAEARQAISMNALNGVGLEVLAASLYAQGKTPEALQAYHVLLIDGANGPIGQTRILLPYALLSLKSGQWEQALAAYNQVVFRLPDVGNHAEDPIVHDASIMQANSYFFPTCRTRRVWRWRSTSLAAWFTIARRTGQVKPKARKRWGNIKQHCNWHPTVGWRITTTRRAGSC